MRIEYTGKNSVRLTVYVEEAIKKLRRKYTRLQPYFKSSNEIDFIYKGEGYKDAVIKEWTKDFLSLLKTLEEYSVKEKNRVVKISDNKKTAEYLFVE